MQDFAKLWVRCLCRRRGCLDGGEGLVLVTTGADEVDWLP